MQTMFKAISTPCPTVKEQFYAKGDVGLFALQKPHRTVVLEFSGGGRIQVLTLGLPDQVFCIGPMHKVGMLIATLSKPCYRLSYPSK